LEEVDYPEASGINKNRVQEQVPRLTTKDLRSQARRPHYIPEVQRLFVFDMMNNLHRISVDFLSKTPFS